MRQDEEILKDSSAALFYNASEWGLPYNRVSAKIMVNYSLKKADQLHYICNMFLRIFLQHTTTFQSKYAEICMLCI